MSKSQSRAQSSLGETSSTPVPYITPTTTPDELVCRVLLIPNDLYWLAAVQGALDELTKTYNWEQVNGITPQEAAERAVELVLQTYESKCLMIGSVIAYAGSDNPDGYLLCDGTSYTKAEYPELAEVIAPSLWNGVTNDNFFVPNLVERFVRGTDILADVGQEGGQATVGLTVDELPKITVEQFPHTHIQNAHTHAQAGHRHIYDKPIANLDLEAPGAPDILGLGQPFIPSGTDWVAPEIFSSTPTNQSATAANKPFGGGLPHENTPPYFALRYFIKAKN